MKSSSEVASDEPEVLVAARVLSLYRFTVPKATETPKQEEFLWEFRRPLQRAPVQNRKLEQEVAEDRREGGFSSIARAGDSRVNCL